MANAVPPQTATAANAVTAATTAIRRDDPARRKPTVASTSATVLASPAPTSCTAASTANSGVVGGPGVDPPFTSRFQPSSSTGSPTATSTAVRRPAPAASSSW
jgi:hypothetical protein